MLIPLPNRIFDVESSWYPRYFTAFAASMVSEKQATNKALILWWEIRSHRNTFHYLSYISLVRITRKSCQICISSDYRVVPSRCHSSRANTGGIFESSLPKRRLKGVLATYPLSLSLSLAAIVGCAGKAIQWDASESYPSKIKWQLILSLWCALSHASTSKLQEPPNRLKFPPRSSVHHHPRWISL